MSDLPFTKDQYLAMQRRQIAVEIEREGWLEVGVDDSWPIQKALHEEWLQLEHLANA